MTKNTNNKKKNLRKKSKAKKSKKSNNKESPKEAKKDDTSVEKQFHCANPNCKFPTKAPTPINAQDAKLTFMQFV